MDVLCAVLPVYLTAMLEHGTSSEVPGMLTLVLDPPSDTNPGIGLERFQQLTDALTAEQRGAVAAALLVFCTQFPDTLMGTTARHSYDAYWSQCLPGDDAR